MVYRVIGLMSGSSLDGLDIAFVEFHENAGQWSFEIKASDCYPYSPEWIGKLRTAVSLSAREYQLLHTDYGHYLGQEVNRFIDQYHLHYQVALIASHGHTTFHMPDRKMTAQLGEGAALAAETGLPVVTDLRALDVAFGGQGAPIVPIGEKLLLKEYDYFLNLGGIANISFNSETYVAFDVCPANRVLNMLAGEAGKDYDEGGKLAASGTIDHSLLSELNGLDYYRQSFPKSLANDFGTDTVYPLIREKNLKPHDALRTFTEHIAIQVKNALATSHPASRQARLLATGGGALNDFLVERLSEQLSAFNTSIVIPERSLINFKEALIMALIGVLRWRQEYNVFSSVTGAARDSIGGALWTGQEA
jgi:anhydro-N-acetylmuramic acid kinase